MNPAQTNGDSATVAVVGAGLAGLTAARALHRAGVDVVVLEAAGRIGGRALTETTTLGSRVDLGGQWIGHDHHRVMAMAREFGATQYPMHTNPLPTVLDGDRTVPVAAPGALVAWLALGAAEVLSRTGVPAGWNNATLGAWLRKLPWHTPRRLLEVIAGTSWTADLDRFSVTAATKFIRHQGGLRTMLATAGGAQDALLVEGIGALVDGLAAELGSRVRTGQRVTSIRRDADGVTLRTATGTVRATKVVVAVPPPVARQISHEPPLPPERLAVERNTYMGTVYKAIAVYDRPFWRERKGGEVIVLDAPGRAVFDTSPPDGPGHLCVLVPGPEARTLDGLDPVARREKILGSLVGHIGPEVLKPVDWHEKAWHLDEFVPGGYTALPEPGTVEGFPSAVPAPVSDIHWAGAETAADHAGYFEGAIASGGRVSREVLAALADREQGAAVGDSTAG
ncbi:FAD-dependent oxidoreductase [Nocardia puris]|uniref:Monoamine oxidase n=1 Tax=Nocardia puris TaxID=208602 RepID=A0A366DB16_9NOCA|nr:FAD-dependent oxidoreductase [Nocardia puris]MBF6214114.1 FAD-dependent oxidoreductase [Nocardia puris]MBF6368602.1 FAD-dependent oxidoreductase [Nocardia puris]MBF6461504.1 FAD-dependent oxidoreductase [Nocardia puris]RBO86624.1 monoamine oxidase [Nocardia puris]